MTETLAAPNTFWSYLPLSDPDDLLIDRIADASFDTPTPSRERSLLLQTILLLPRLAKDAGKKVSDRSVASAYNIARNIPLDRKLPAVSYDEDGTVVMFWDFMPQPFMIVVDGAILYMIVNPGVDSEHLPRVIYGGDYLPRSILSRLQTLA